MTRIFLARLSFFIALLSFLLNSAAISQSLNQSPPFLLPNKTEISRLRSGVIELESGVVRFELYPEEAPWHVANLKWLADQGFFKNKPIDTVKPNYIIQFGKLGRNEFSKFIYALPPEFNDISHDRGTIGMARLPDEKNPGRASSSTQVHIILKDVHKLDGNYTPFGKIIEGMDLLDRARVGDRIRDLIVYVRR